MRVMDVIHHNIDAIMMVTLLDTIAWDIHHVKDIARHGVTDITTDITQGMSQRNKHKAPKRHNHNKVQLCKQ